MDQIFADACNDGISFILQSPDLVPEKGGLIRDPGQGHLVTITGRGGTGKSLLALQFLTDLLEQSKGVPAAFYFTLEASPWELARQLQAFKFGHRYSRCNEPPGNRQSSDGRKEPSFTNMNPESLYGKCAGLHIKAIPSPTEDLSVLIRQVRQTIADELAKQALVSESNQGFDDLVGIVIDPLGGVRSRETLRTDLSSLKHLADSHKTYLFLLAEDHIYEQHRSIEHYSQTVLQLRQDPSSLPSRLIFVQKARNQPFREGNHHLELLPDWGVTVYPSVEAQSAYAHKLRNRPSKLQKAKMPAPFIDLDEFDELKDIADGSAIFLMGPPGTFKQFIANKFVTALKDASSLYISFKAEMSVVEKGAKGFNVQPCPSDNNPPRRRKMEKDPRPTIWFIDARSPLSTPQEILSRVRIKIGTLPDEPHRRRAVVWGLRRLADMPNFSGNVAMQFLEALVTLLQAERTTCLLVDWPDIEKGNTLPIVDLSQYILLTRLCYSRGDIEGKKEVDPEYLKTIADEIWTGKKEGSAASPRRRRMHKGSNSNSIYTGQPSHHAVLLRIQRDNETYNRDVGFKFVKSTGPEPDVDRIQEDLFEACWKVGGEQWEKDPGLS